jgi:ABC-type sulfate transport system permease component
MKHLKLLVLSLVLLATTSAPAFAYYDPDTSNPGAAIADAILVRPVMLGVSLVGTALYVVTLPLTFLTDTDEEAGCALMRAPWWFTSGRNLGEFHSYQHP